jgi:dinuclear metal center YbgI/SA1388 family protein
MILKEIIDYLEELAPPALQESYDNSGLIIGQADYEITKAIICLDALESVIDEAIELGANLIIAHHPIIFSALNRINGKNYVERIVIKAIRNQIAIYAIHTNLDNVIGGVNQMIASKIGLANTRILSPKNNGLSKLIVYVPAANKPVVLQSLFEAGAGNIGNYSEASFTSSGEGSFKGNENSTPSIGEKNKRAYVKEDRVEVLLENHNMAKVLAALKSSHPYEEVAYDLIALQNSNQDTGSGMIGELNEAMLPKDFLRHLQEIFKVPVVRHTKLIDNKISKVAVCGGAGSFLLKAAISQKADIFISADFKYHEFFDADNQIVIADIGHYESEQYTSELLMKKLNKNFSNFAFFLTENNTNPLRYFI